MFAYFAVPSFWFFIVSFVFLSRIIIYQKALANFDVYQTREEQKQALLRFYGFFYVCVFIMVLCFQHILISKWLTFFTSGFIWVTQIISNIQNASRSTPNMGYAISQQLSISLLPLYLRGCPTNIMSLKPCPTFITAYLFVIGLQFGIMHIQQTKGPKYLIPKRFRAQQYNYLQTFIDTTDLESGTLTANAPETGEECVICMYTLRNQVNNEMQPMPNMISNTYMRTPCRHKFHQNCLQNWMRVKLECPVCREVLPPFENDE